MTSATSGGSAASGRGSVDRVAECELRVRDEAWPYALLNGDAIDRHWTERIARSPAFFNGTILMLADAALDGGQFSAVLRPVEFKSFLYWRDQGCPETGVRDAFGSALIRSADGHVLLGRQRAGNLNAGLAYLPGGFIDPRDVGADGRVDIEANVRRELAEETGLGRGDLERVPGFIVTRIAAQVSIGIELRSPLPAGALAARITEFLAADAEAELAAVEIVRCAGDLARLAVPPYAALLLREVLAR